MEYLYALTVLNIALLAAAAWYVGRKLRRLTEGDAAQRGLELLFKEELRASRLDAKSDLHLLRRELANSLGGMNDSLLKRIADNQRQQLMQLDSFSAQLHQLISLNDSKFDKLRDTVDGKLQAIQFDNNAKLEVMRQTVAEKLHATLEERLGGSFKLVSRQLEEVHRGLGEMQSLASGVGDLKKILGNIKTRGIWGEIQLGALLEQVMAPQQYACNVATVPRSDNRVEFAVKLPGRSDDDTVVWLPIDAKFPQEDYQRLLDAQDITDAKAAEEFARALETRLKNEAKMIVDKYIAPPHTTDFAIMFLPVEGLYAEALRRPGLCEFLMTKYKVVIAGPTTLAALLNSLQLGFRTLAIEQRSAEVWRVLGAVKTEFGKFAELLDKTHKKLQEASNSIDTAARKTRTIERRLKDVENIPVVESRQLLKCDGNDYDD